jgi:hypothetical protein
VPLQPERHPRLLDLSEADQLDAQRGGQPGGLLVGVDEQKRPVPGEGVTQPRRGGGGLGLLEGPGVDQPTVPVVVAQHLGIAAAQPQRRLPLPRLAKPARLGQLVAGTGLGEQVHPAARANRGQLAVIADQQQLRPGGVHVAVNRGQGGGVGHR